MIQLQLFLDLQHPFIDVYRYHCVVQHQKQYQYVRIKTMNYSINSTEEMQKFDLDSYLPAEPEASASVQNSTR